MLNISYLLTGCINQFPDYSVFGRKTTLRINPDHILDLHWNLANTYHTTSIGSVDTQNTIVSTHYIDVETVTYARGDKCEDWDGTILNTNTSVSWSSPI